MESAAPNYSTSLASYRPASMAKAASTLKRHRHSESSSSGLCTENSKEGHDTSFDNSIHLLADGGEEVARFSGPAALHNRGAPRRKMLRYAFCVTTDSEATSHCLDPTTETSTTRLSQRERSSDDLQDSRFHGLHGDSAAVLASCAVPYAGASASASGLSEDPLHRPDVSTGPKSAGFPFSLSSGRPSRTPSIFRQEVSAGLGKSAGATSPRFAGLSHRTDLSSSVSQQHASTATASGLSSAYGGMRSGSDHATGASSPLAECLSQHAPGASCRSSLEELSHGSATAATVAAARGRDYSCSDRPGARTLRHTDTKGYFTSSRKDEHKEEKLNEDRQELIHDVDSVEERSLPDERALPDMKEASSRQEFEPYGRMKGSAVVPRIVSASTPDVASFLRSDSNRPQWIDRHQKKDWQLMTGTKDGMTSRFREPEVSPTNDSQSLSCDEKAGNLKDSFQQEGTPRESASLAATFVLSSGRRWEGRPRVQEDDRLDVLVMSESRVRTIEQFVLSSGRGRSPNVEVAPEVERPATIDDEFEQYFAKLLL